MDTLIAKYPSSLCHEIIGIVGERSSGEKEGITENQATEKSLKISMKLYKDVHSIVSEILIP